MTRTLNDLRRGHNAQPSDVLRLAMHYLIRGGWCAEPRKDQRLRPMPPGLADGPVTISEATQRARMELCAPWMTGLRASHLLYRTAGFETERPEPLRDWELAAGRTADDIKELFKAAIFAAAADQKGTLVDVQI